MDSKRPPDAPAPAILLVDPEAAIAVSKLDGVNGAYVSRVTSIDDALDAVDAVTPEAVVVTGDVRDADAADFFTAITDVHDDISCIWVSDTPPEQTRYTDTLQETLDDYIPWNTPAYKELSGVLIRAAPAATIHGIEPARLTPDWFDQTAAAKYLGTPDTITDRLEKVVTVADADFGYAVLLDAPSVKVIGAVGVDPSDIPGQDTIAGYVMLRQGGVVIRDPGDDPRFRAVDTFATADDVEWLLGHPISHVNGVIQGAVILGGWGPVPRRVHQAKVKRVAAEITETLIAARGDTDEVTHEAAVPPGTGEQTPVAEIEVSGATDSEAGIDITQDGKPVAPPSADETVPTSDSTTDGVDEMDAPADATDESDNQEVDTSPSGADAESTTEASDAPTENDGHDPTTGDRDADNTTADADADATDDEEVADINDDDVVGDSGDDDDDEADEDDGVVSLTGDDSDDETDEPESESESGRLW